MTFLYTDLSMDFQDLIRKVTGTEPTASSLMDLLRRPGFLVSGMTGFDDHEVRAEIIRRLGRIGDQSALEILHVHLTRRSRNQTG